MQNMFFILSNSYNYLLIFYFVGFGLFCLESLLSIWVIQVSFSVCSILILQNQLKGKHLNPFGFYTCSKYACTSEEAERLQR
jgi:hypothetical protein